VNIAFFAIGSGPPLIICPFGPFSHLRLEQQIPQTREMEEYLGRGRTLIRYDSRGFGLSDRASDDFSLNASVRDLEAVVDELQLEEVQLLSVAFSAMVAIAYAARHPGRVSHLGLVGGVAWPDDFPWDPWESIWDLAAKNWAMACDATAALLWPADIASERASILKEEVTPQAYISFWKQVQEWDVSDVALKVTANTLVVGIASLAGAAATQGQAQRTAAAIPGARLLPNELPTGGLTLDNVVDFDQFFPRVEGVKQDEEPPVRLPSGTAIILFADIANSTGLTEELGDAGFRDKARDLDTALRSAIKANGGTAIEGKLLGDGVLATFGAAREAIACAQACHDAASGVDLQLHVGIHAGDVIREDNNVFGGAVNVAARISDASAAGETLVSGTVRDLARTSAGVEFEDRGERDLKGVSDPVRVWAVRP
jgi:class 3 adenylate cyclase